MSKKESNEIPEGLLRPSPSLPPPPKRNHFLKEYNKTKLETHEIEMIKVLLNCGKFTSEEIASQFNVTREKIREIYKEK